MNTTLECGVAEVEAKERKWFRLLDKSGPSLSSRELSLRRLKRKIDTIEACDENDIYVDPQEKDKYLRAAGEEGGNLRTANDEAAKKIKEF